MGEDKGTVQMHVIIFAKLNLLQVSECDSYSIAL